MISMRNYPIHVLLADRQPIVVCGARYVLSTTSTMAVTKAAHDSKEMMDALASQCCDVLVADYAISGARYSEGLALFDVIRQHYPKLGVVVTTTTENAVLTRALIDLGIRCIISKSDMTGHLIKAIHSAFVGGIYLSPAMHKILYSNETLDRNVRALSAREVEVVRLYASGLSVKQIAGKRSRSVKTISTQKTNAMAKLGIKCDADLVRYALEAGLGG